MVSIDGRILRNMIVGGANEVTESTASLNALNVFPVPDGDTGTNMGHTVRAAAKEAVAQHTPNIAEVAKAASNGALRGARGNSGVILSQLFRGFAKGLEGKAKATAEDLAIALAKASEMAYKAVMKPKEGTMLTIGRAAAEAAHEIAFDEQNIVICTKFVIAMADEMLAKTPQMLPVLKQAGVVDSGGMGVVLFYKGALKGLEAEGELTLLMQASEGNGEVVGGATVNVDDIKFAYCTEFLVELTPPAKRAPGVSENAEEVLRAYLPTIGDSVVVIEDAGLVKVHVHTNNPGKAMEKALKFGMLLNIKIDNMKQQNADLAAESSASSSAHFPHSSHAPHFSNEEPPSNEPPKPIGVVAVVAGAGMAELFKGLGADYVIEGGQSMNPSAEDIATAIERVNAEAVVVLPNNSNITLTAAQAGKLVSGKQVGVVPSKNIPQGVACMVAFDSAAGLDENVDTMGDAMEAVHCGQITQAVRDTVMNDKEIHEGDYLGIFDGDIVIVNREQADAVNELVDYMMRDGGDIVSVFHGEGATAEGAAALGAYVNEKYPDAEVELYDGGQPVYGYIISVE